MYILLYTIWSLTTAFQNLYYHAVQQLCPALKWEVIIYTQTMNSFMVRVMVFNATFNNISFIRGGQFY
jgi:hypothetical protein